jgi:hypothetical protein
MSNSERSLSTLNALAMALKVSAVHFQRVAQDSLGEEIAYGNVEERAQGEMQ